MHFGALRAARGWFGATRSDIEHSKLQRMWNDRFSPRGWHHNVCSVLAWHRKAIGAHCKSIAALSCSAMTLQSLMSGCALERHFDLGVSTSWCCLTLLFIHSSFLIIYYHSNRSLANFLLHFLSSTCIFLHLYSCNWQSRSQILSSRSPWEAKVYGFLVLGIFKSF